MINLKTKLLFDDVKLPTYATDGSACFDIYSHEYARTIRAQSSESFRTGLCFEIPSNHVMKVFSRSGHGVKYGIRLSNGTGIIDPDYRGELIISLYNDSFDAFSVQMYDRIAQALIVPIEKVNFEVVNELSSTVRGTGGHGSTGR